MLDKDDISVCLTWHFVFLLLRTREGCMPTMTKSRLIAAGEIPFKHAWARLLSTEIDRDSAVINLAYLFTGLITITQSHLVHHILQGVEHTDPTEWSNSHRSIGDKFCDGCSTNSHFLKAIHYFLFNNNLVIHVTTASQHFVLFKCTESVIKGSQLHIYVTCCFANSSIIYRLYFNIINTI